MFERGFEMIEVHNKVQWLVAVFTLGAFGIFWRLSRSPLCRFRSPNSLIG